MAATSSVPTHADTTTTVLFPAEAVGEGVVLEVLSGPGEVGFAPGRAPVIVEVTALLLDCFVVAAVADAGAAENPLSWQ
jgi:hypothetical protein